jgi:hypothetical protein
MNYFSCKVLVLLAIVALSHITLVFLLLIIIIVVIIISGGVGGSKTASVV